MQSRRVHSGFGSVAFGDTPCAWPCVGRSRTGYYEGSAGSMRNGGKAGHEGTETRNKKSLQDGEKQV